MPLFTPSYPKISSTFLSLNSATWLTVFNEAKPSIVALTMLIGVLEPIHFDKMSVYPANSTTARTGPPAMIPVPWLAGLINTLPDP